MKLILPEKHSAHKGHKSIKWMITGKEPAYAKGARSRAPEFSPFPFPFDRLPRRLHTLLCVFSLDLLSSVEKTFKLNGGGRIKLIYFETSVPRLVCGDNETIRLSSVWHEIFACS